MLKRKITTQLEQWRTRREQNCLLIKGARQVGKTYTISQFGKDRYESFIYLNFIESPEVKAMFDGDLSSTEIKKRITLFIRGARLIPNGALLFIDEIQECPNARTALKFLAQDGTIDVIASGSLLGLSYREVTSIPVGYERQIEMHGLDFEEYLWALGYDESATDMLREHFVSLSPVPEGIRRRMLSNLREFMAIGGMPAVVQTFVDMQNFMTAFSEQEMILNSYLDDIAKDAMNGPGQHR